jgi:proteasome accessory factor B
MNVSRIYRLLRIVTLLQSGRCYTANELAEELQISRRTVFRDLNALELAHIPYYYDPQRQGYRISRHFFLPPVNLSLSEAMALLVLSGRLDHQANVPLLSEGAQAAAKLESILPQAIRDHTGSLLDRLSVRLGPLAEHDSADHDFNTLTDAIARHLVCTMHYQSFHEGKTIRVEVHPLRLVFMHRAWYLLAWTPTEKAIRTYKLIRIETLTVGQRTFSTRREKELNDHFGQAWSMIPEGKVHRVHLHFKKKVAGNVAEVLWHSSQRFEWNDDGSAEMFVEVDGLGEISWWVLGYGDQVKVVSPKPLADRVCAIARSVVQQYSEGG